MAFDQVSPLPDRRSDLQAASIVAATWNVALTQGGSEVRFSPEDFVLSYGPRKPKAAAAKKPSEPNWKKMKMTAMIVAGASLQGFGADNGPKKRK